MLSAPRGPRSLSLAHRRGRVLGPERRHGSRMCTVAGGKGCRPLAYQLARGWRIACRSWRRRGPVGPVGGRRP